MTDTNNPYAAPTTNPTTTNQEFSEVKIFSVSGRIGRVRYIGYTVGISLLVALVGGILGALTMGVGLILGYVVMIVISIMLTIQRCHDFNTTGWLSILGLIPLVNFIFWFIPGTDGANDYGNKTPPNSTLSILLACIVPLIFVLGIVAAIAIPAYQGYVKRAKSAQMRLHPHQIDIAIILPMPTAKQFA